MNLIVFEKVGEIKYSEIRFGIYFLILFCCQVSAQKSWSHSRNTGVRFSVRRSAILRVFVSPLCPLKWVLR